MFIMSTTHKLGTMSVRKLILTMSVPIMISMLTQALYNVVDSIYVSRYSFEAFTALSLAYPVQQVMSAISVGTNVGTNALLSYSLGQGNLERANKAANTAVFLALINWTVFIILGIFFSRAIIAAQTSNPVIIQHGQDYLSLVTIFSIGIFGQMAFERILIASGYSVYPMITQITGAVINIILDPIFIFGWFGVPEMGVKGAAIATIIGQVVAMILAYTFIRLKNKYVKFKPSLIFKPELEIIKRIYKVGLPSILLISLSSVMVFFLNRILSAFTDAATAVLGAYFRLQSFAFMPVFGLNNGLVPIVSYNYGSKQYDRMKDAVKFALKLGIGVTLTGFLIFQFFTPTLLNLFEATPEMLQIGIPALRIISFSFLFAGYNIVLSSVFQALQRGTISLFISFCRQILFILPIAYGLSKTNVLSNIWWSIPLAEVVSFCLTTFFIIRIIRLVNENAIDN